MIVGVISDTHDRLLTIDHALDEFARRSVELIVHVGDWKALETAQYFAAVAAERSLPVRGVLGNNDTDVTAFLAFAAEAPGDFELYEGVWTMPLATGRSLAAYHGHHLPTLRKVLADPEFEFVCLGHTHKPRIDRDGGKLVVNPGSTAFAIPRRKDWTPTVAVIDTVRMSAETVTLAAMP